MRDGEKSAKAPVESRGREIWEQPTSRTRNGPFSEDQTSSEGSRKVPKTPPFRYRDPSRGQRPQGSTEGSPLAHASPIINRRTKVSHLVTPSRFPLSAFPDTFYPPPPFIPREERERESSSDGGGAQGTLETNRLRGALRSAKSGGENAGVEQMGRREREQIWEQVWDSRKEPD